MQEPEQNKEEQDAEGAVAPAEACGDQAAAAADTSAESPCEETSEAASTAPAQDKCADTNVPVQPSVAPDTKPSAKFSLFELVVGVFVLAVFAVLVMNVSILALARDYNKRCCKQAIMYAGQAATEGKDTPSIWYSSLHYLDRCALPGLFIERPMITSFDDNITPSLRKLTITMSTRALVPVPVLLFNPGALESDGQHLVYRTTCVFNLKIPRTARALTKSYRPPVVPPSR
ncbi:MAG: hypothetical protein HC888_14785 [Candidatus Competibacteraceae bacterium]|nr:hypothetical protein [Candidatus Competibacteraceae bacterium]